MVRQSVETIRRSIHAHPWQSAAWVFGSTLAVCTFAGILYEYQWYFPPNFDRSAFLGGRRYTFGGIYRPAFYAHIISGPVVMILATFSMLSSGQPTLRNWHQLVGRWNVMLILLIVVPSGFLMSLQAYGGMISIAGFMVQTVLTGLLGLCAILSARKRQFANHRTWALRLYAILMSPLLLRVIAGVLIVTGYESAWTYRINAWISWMIPLGAIEYHLYRTER